MKIEIWSDIACPFCYIGKKKLDKVLQDFPFADSVQIEWKSYQLDPNFVTDTSIRSSEFLSKHKGISIEDAQRLNDQVSAIASREGLTFNFDSAVMANSFHAHILSHYAKNQGKQHEIEELLFASFFTEGKNIDDLDFLSQLATSVGLDGIGFKASVQNKVYHQAVHDDIAEVQQIGVRGVPFFVFDRKYAISGAQDIQVFKETLAKAFNEWKQENSSIQIVADGNSCDIGGCKS